MDMDMDSGGHNHVFDPALDEQNQNGADAAAAAASSSAGVNADGTPAKRRPGRPKGSTKKNLLAGSPLPPKIKRPVGRPRKDGLPAGSIGPRVKRERTAGVQQVYAQQLPGVAYPPMAFGYSISAPLPPAPAPPLSAPVPVFQLDPSLADNDWGDLARTNPNAFLSTLLTALAAPNPVSSAGPTVEEAFKSHLVSLAPNPAQMQPIPSLYSILKTFWLPSSPAYFSLTASASTARTPSEHRFLYWDPQPLVFNGIACPSCSAPLINKGRISSGPVKIYDIERPFFIVGCEYVCRSPPCVAATGSPDGRKYASTDSSILRSLPMLLKDEFPARLLNGEADAGSAPNVWNWKATGVSTGLWNLVMGALRAGLRKDVILRLIWSVQHKVPDVQMEMPVVMQNGQHPQPQPQAAAPAEAGAQGDTDDKMGEGEDEAEEGDEVNQSQTLSSSAFADAYGDAWKENMADSPAKKTPAPAPASSSTPAAAAPTNANAVASTSASASASASAVPTPTPAPAPAVSTPQPQPQPQPMQMAPPYNPYTAYPFTPYAYMPPPHHLVNGQGQLVPVPVSMQVPSNAPPPSASGTNGLAVPANGTGTPDGQPTTTTGGAQTKRSPRHCCKCGSQDCKGKGGRSFCANGCQDCGKVECKGRNSRRPDKKCSEGWA
ncbi:hypothetical protein GALMADRAFT_244245 [Galerina marginata CBS 339.88]|uniref:Post-SET domain-containing protein n=1 Tax=Galerina marginata (strain CBS 339.88) TaxID=685588 RepID=A0A067T8M7_GALM3|nr:hypothetical protein GALMADRAFT_244245 [Galerina marginata CBS 339.88]